jgi:hypothetical protein
MHVHRLELINTIVLYLQHGEVPSVLVKHWNVGWIGYGGPQDWWPKFQALSLGNTWKKWFTSKKWKHFVLRTV